MSKTYLMALPLLCLYSCTTGNASDNSNMVGNIKDYPVVAVLEKDTSLHLQYVANIQARKNVEIHSRVSGILEEIHVDEGETVRKGQLLFTIDDDELQIELSKKSAALNISKADARVAEVEVERVKALVEKNIVSSTELDLAEAKLNALKAKTEEARAEKAAIEKRLSYTKIRSPFEGVIDRLPLKTGSLLSDGSLLTTISDIHTILAYFNLSENEYLQLIRSSDDDSMASNNVSLVLSDGTEYPHHGLIDASESEINEATGSIAFRADFPNPDRVLRHGASATVIISKPPVAMLMVPQKAVLEIQDKNYVYVVGDDNIVRMRNFEPAQRINGYYVVREGLSSGDRIVYEGIQSIRDGEKIKPMFIKAM